MQTGKFRYEVEGYITDRALKLILYVSQKPLINIM